jgi:hypothetical protein
MKYVITESQFNEFIYRFIDEILGGLEEKTIKSHPTMKFFVNSNKKPLFNYNIDNQSVVLDHKGITEHIYNYLENVFGINPNQSHRIFKQWFLDIYGINVNKIY